MRILSRRRATTPSRAEDGFTLVELTVSLTLLAVIFTSVAGVFMTGVKSAASGNRRSTAYSLATKSLEELRALPYVQVGFYEDQAGYAAQFESLDTVSLGATTPVDTTVILTSESVTIDPLTYTVTRHIVWSDAKSGTGATLDDAYKRLTVFVTWTDQVGPHTIRQDSVLYPGGRGVYSTPKNNSASGGTTTTTLAPGLSPNPPTDLSATVPAAPAGETQIDLAWLAPVGGVSVAYYQVQQASDSSFVSGVTTYPQQTGLTFSATGLGDNTTYYYRVLAYSSSGQESLPSNVVSATTLTDPTTTCEVASLSVTGASSGSTSKTYVQNGNGKMSENLNLSVNFTGSCTGTFAVKGVDSSTATDPGSPYGVSGTSGSTRTGTIAASGTTWALGVHTFTVLLNGSVTSPAVTKSFLVCAYVKPSDQSSNPNVC